MHALMARGISVVTLGVADMERARRYYASIFESPGPAPGSGPCYFRLPGSWLALYPRHDLASYFGVDPAGSGFSAVTMSINVTAPEHVDALCERLRGAGGTVSAAPGPASWGGRVACVADADGHLLELVWNPRFESLLATAGAGA